MLGMFSVQLQQVLSPAAAAMHARGDEAGLRNLLLRSSRLTFFLVTPCYLLSAVYLEPLIHVLTGMPSVPRNTWWIGQALLLAVFSSQLTNSCSKRVLMMCGGERKLLWVSIAEALANAVLSVILAYRIGVLGVAIGTLIPTVLVGWFWVIPMTLAKLRLPLTAYLSYHIRGALAPLAVFAAVLAVLAVWVPAAGSSGFFELGWRGALCMAPLLFLGRHVIRGISRPEGDALT
jgi:O-antigen/teichoic acid export membrane protein